MITKEQVIKLGDGSLHVEIHCEAVYKCQRIVGPRGGVKEKIVKCRPSGRCQTWKRDQARFRLPVKHGMYESGEITDRNAQYFHLATDCPALAQERTDIRLASDLQRTIDEQKLKSPVVSLERIGDDTFDEDRDSFPPLDADVGDDCERYNLRDEGRNPDGSGESYAERNH